MSPLPISLDVSYSYDNNLFVLVSFPLFYRLFVEKEIVTSVEMQYSEKIPLEFLRFFLRSGNNFWEVDWNNSPQEKSSTQIFVRDRNQIFVKQWNPRRVCRDGSEMWLSSGRLYWSSFFVPELSKVIWVTNRRAKIEVWKESDN